MKIAPLTLQKDRKILSALASGKYDVTLDGRIFNKNYNNSKTMKEVSYSGDGNGYIKVFLIGCGMVKRSRVVGIAFHGFQKNYREINHKNGNKADDSAANLEWVSRSQNTQHAVDTGLQSILRGSSVGTHVLSEAQVAEIHTIWRQGSVTQYALSEKYGVSRTTIKKILAGDGWRGVFPGKHLNPHHLSHKGAANGNVKLVESQVREIKAALKMRANHRDLANKYGVSAYAIYAIATGKTWKHLV